MTRCFRGVFAIALLTAATVQAKEDTIDTFTDLDGLRLDHSTFNGLPDSLRYDTPPFDWNSPPKLERPLFYDYSSQPQMHIDDSGVRWTTPAEEEKYQAEQREIEENFQRMEQWQEEASQAQRKRPEEKLMALVIGFVIAAIIGVCKACSK